MKNIFVVLVGGVVLIAGVFLMKNNSSVATTGIVPAVAEVNNVSVIDGKQIINIHARGGYNPVHSVAKSGLPTILRFYTSGTFDCSASVRIPSMNLSKSLPQTGTTDIDIGTQSVATLQGTCSMGMYPFSVEFKS